MAALAGGCGGVVSGPPETLEQLQAYRASQTRPYDLDEITAHNLRRTLDPTVCEEERIASLTVVVHLAGDEPAHLSHVHSLLAMESTPERLRLVAVLILARRDCPGVGPHVLDTLGSAASHEGYQTLVDWLARHRRPEALSDLVRLWAHADPEDPATEDRFRRAVETTAGQSWSSAVLSALNQPEFTAKRSALAVLTVRLTPTQLRQRLATLEPRVIAVEALQHCLQQADYLPAPSDLLAVVEAYVGCRGDLDAALAVARTWAEVDGYEFKIADMHLLAGVAGGPWAYPKRATVLAEAAQQLRKQSRRAHPRTPTTTDRSPTPLERLSIASLIRLALINDMLASPDICEGLAAVVAGETANAGGRWGGLIVLSDGGAMPRLYAPGGNAADGPYTPSAAMVQDARHALAYIHGGAVAAPTAADRARMQQLGIPGVVVCLTAHGQLAAAYYEGEAVAVPLGAFPVGP